MKRTMQVALLFTLLTAVLQANSAGLLTRFALHVETFGVMTSDSAARRVVFPGMSRNVELSITVAAPQDETPVGTGIDLSRPDWWNSVQWKLSKDGQRSTATPEFVSGEAATKTTSGAIAKVGERMVATFRLPNLPVGSYVLRAQIGSLSTNEVSFLVSTGTESDDLRREFARYRVLNSRSAPELRANLKELARLDPLNAAPWIRLGDLALNEGDAQAARRNFETADKILGSRADQFRGGASREVAEGIASRRKNLDQLRILIDEYMKSPSTLEIIIEGTPDKRYVLRNRTDGATVRIVRGNDS